MVKILYFGRLTDITQTSLETRTIPETLKTTDELRAWLDQQYSANGALLEKSVRIAINNELIQETANFSQTDELAFMPPVGGG